MCLFIQNQDFQKHTETVLNLLSHGARQAADQLRAMNSSMGGQLVAMRRMSGSLAELEQGQQEVSEGVQRGLASMQQLQSQALSVDDKLAHALQNEVGLPCARRPRCIALHRGSRYTAKASHAPSTITDQN